MSPRLRQQGFANKSEQIMKQLVKAYQDVKTGPSSQCFLIYGASGSGKTTLARSLKTIVEQDGGYWMSGTFDRYSRPEPFAAFCDALREFAKTVALRGEEHEIRSAVEAAGIPSEVHILETLVPELKTVFGDESASLDMPEETKNEEPQSAASAALNAEAASQFQYAIRIFMRTVCSPKRPLVLLIEALHAADQTCIDLSKALAVDRESRHVLFLGTFRDEKHLEWHNNFNHFLSSLDIPVDPKCTMVHLTCLGGQSGHKVIQGKVAGLPEPTQEFLKIASCLGMTLDDRLLRHLIEPVECHFDQAAAINLIVFDEQRDCWLFAREGIREAVYDLIPKIDLNSLHRNIGRTLWRELDMKQLDVFIFVVVDLLMSAGDLVLEQRERTAVSKLCFRAGERATELSGFRIAFKYLLHAISLVGHGAWREDYEYCLRLHNMAVEVAYCAGGEIDTLFELIENIFAHARSCDMLRAQAMKVYVLGDIGKIEESVMTGLKSLRNLGETFPPRPNLVHVFVALKRLSWRLKGKTKRIDLTSFVDD